MMKRPVIKKGIKLIVIPVLALVIAFYASIYWYSYGKETNKEIWEKNSGIPNCGQWKTDEFDLYGSVRIFERLPSDFNLFNALAFKEALKDYLDYIKKSGFYGKFSDGLYNSPDCYFYNNLPFGRYYFFSFVTPGVYDEKSLQAAISDWRISPCFSYPGRKKAIKLIRDKINIEERDRFMSRTPLMKAVMFGQTDLIKMLIEAGANVNATDASKRSALYYACNHSYSPIFKPDVQSQEVVVTAFRAAADVTSTEVKLLLDSGADPCLPDENGVTPFLAAIESRNLGTACQVAGITDVLKKKTVEEHFSYFFPRQDEEKVNPRLISGYFESSTIETRLKEKLARHVNPGK
ncbi:MAG: ankyrin repeat domain-containing protein [Candidatus Wallbacteria bacterium]|nr:ankyrin repeat domain-containing protein [Candidatus Wallbacteria bacterium]